MQGAAGRVPWQGIAAACASFCWLPWLALAACMFRPTHPPPTPPHAGARSHSEMADALPYELAHSAEFDQASTGGRRWRRDGGPRQDGGKFLLPSALVPGGAPLYPSVGCVLGTPLMLYLSYSIHPPTAQALEQVADYRPPTTAATGRYTLKRGLWAEFDPFFLHYTRWCVCVGGWVGRN